MGSLLGRVGGFAVTSLLLGAAFLNGSAAQAQFPFPNQIPFDYEVHVHEDGAGRTIASPSGDHQIIQRVDGSFCVIRRQGNYETREYSTGIFVEKFYDPMLGILQYRQLNIKTGQIKIGAHDSYGNGWNHYRAMR